MDWMEGWWWSCAVLGILFFVGGVALCVSPACVCVCVCAWERGGRERARPVKEEGGREGGGV